MTAASDGWCSGPACAQKAGTEPVSALRILHCTRDQVHYILDTQQGPEVTRRCRLCCIENSLAPTPEGLWTCSSCRRELVLVLSLPTWPLPTQTTDFQVSSQKAPGNNLPVSCDHMGTELSPSSVQGPLLPTAGE